MKPISIIVAIAENNGIGKNNDLLWHLSDDLKRFKKLTSGHKIIMGKRTFDSLPIRPLPNRISVVLSDNESDKIEGCEMAYSIEEAVNKCDNDKENFIIGGGMVYKQFMDIADTLYITKVHKEFDADTFFPEINPQIWELTNDEGMQQEKDLYYSYLTYKRIK